MRRSGALEPLSRDHHHALVIASALSRAGEGTATSSAMLFADYILEHEAYHFALEESLLLPALPPGEPALTLAERVLSDHEHLRDAAKQLKEGRLQPNVELARSLGRRLRDHVRLEERQLFPCIEETLDADALERLGRALDHGRAAPCREDAVDPGRA